MVKVNRFRFEKSAGVFIRIRIVETIYVKQGQWTSLNGITLDSQTVTDHVNQMITISK
jgi:hypothetical protein